MPFRRTVAQGGGPRTRAVPAAARRRRNAAACDIIGRSGSTEISPRRHWRRCRKILL